VTTVMMLPATSRASACARRFCTAMFHMANNNDKRCEVERGCDQHPRC
jgi:hypothetical protein